MIASDLINRVMCGENVSYLIEDEPTKSVDKSSNPTVVQYAIQGMIKRGSSVAAAAKRTSERLSGGSNMFLGAPTDIVSIDSKKLEIALWDYLVDHVIKAIDHIKPGKEDFALGGARNTFNQKSAKFEDELRKRVETKLGKTLEQLGQERQIKVEGEQI